MTNQAGFLPSTHGFHFGNAFQHGAAVITAWVPLLGDVPLGDAGGGMCGGMVFAALDFFHEGRLPPPDTTVPPPGSPLFAYLARRLIDSFNGPRGINKYISWMRLPNESGLFKSIHWHIINHEWPAIKNDLDNGQPCPLGLLRMRSLNPFDAAKNHQVLATGYELNDATGDLQIAVYDPNWPDRDDLALSLNITGPDNLARVSYSGDMAGRGFFRSKYAPQAPPR